MIFCPSGKGSILHRDAIRVIEAVQNNIKRRWVGFSVPDNYATKPRLRLYCNGLIPRAIASASSRCPSGCSGRSISPTGPFCPDTPGLAGWLSCASHFAKQASKRIVDRFGIAAELCYQQSGRNKGLRTFWFGGLLFALLPEKELLDELP